MSKIDKDEFLSEIQKNRESTQQQFDTVKLTVGTAGILVALSLNSDWIESPVHIFGISAYKLTLVLDLASMLMVVSSFFVAELMFKWLEKFVVRDSLNTWQRWLLSKISRENAKRIGKMHSFYRWHLPNHLISTLNHLASILLILAIGTFLYMAVLM